MILGFKQQFPWKEPTYFREKILAGGDGIKNQKPWPPKHWFPGAGDLAFIMQQTPKIHTMREDPYDRWKPGMSIQMVYRGPKYSILDHFNKGIPELEKLKGKQKCRVQYNDKITPDLRPCGIYIDDQLVWEGFVGKSFANSCGSEKDRKWIESFAKNDGFESSIEFFRWFKKDWSGFILHWTDFRY